MKSKVLGDGRPEHAIISCIHGDEPCGWEAIQKLIDSELEFKKPVKVILANEKAFKRNQRSVDSDLNRSFPGDPNSENYEERLGSKIMNEIEGMKVLDIHSTESRPVPFGIITDTSESSLDVAEATGIGRIADLGYVDGGFIKYVEAGIAVEFEKQGDDSASDAYEVILNFLKYFNVIDGDPKTLDTEIYEVYDEVEGSGYTFIAENFEPVEKGEVFAEKENSQKVADEKFWPVLMSTDGYDDMIGFKAKRKKNMNQ